jgi:hypothetical protein
MTPEEIIQEIRDIRGSMDTLCTRVFELSRTLYSKARREATKDTMGSLVLYANTWTRLSGAVSQGLQRTASADRVLKYARDDQERQEREAAERERREQEREDRAAKRQASASPVVPPSDSGLEDLIELYGKEVVNANR